MHKDTITLGLLRPQQLEPDHRVVDNTPEALKKLVRKAGPPAPLHAC